MLYQVIWFRDIFVNREIDELILNCFFFYFLVHFFYIYPFTQLRKADIFSIIGIPHGNEYWKFTLNHHKFNEHFLLRLTVFTLHDTIHQKHLSSMSLTYCRFSINSSFIPYLIINANRSLNSPSVSFLLICYKIRRLR